MEQELACEVHDVRCMLYKENKRRFVDEERVGYKEDLLISTILDPHFKLMNYPGCTNEMKEDAEIYLRSTYRLDWSPSTEAKAKRLAEVAEGIDKADYGVEDASPTTSSKVVAPLFKKEAMLYC